MAGKKVLMVVAPQDFRDEEFFTPKKVFEAAGVKVTVASEGVSEARGVLGGTVRVDAELSSVSAKDFDAVVFIGGPGSEVYFDDEAALSLARESYSQGKVTAAICIAPTIFANAGVLEGRKATVWSSPASREYVNALKDGGAKYTGESVVADGNIVTADGPASAQKFAEKVLEKLGG
jgi:protease I